MSSTDGISSPPPPPTMIILGTYLVLGAAISFLVGRKPGTLPDDLLIELAPSVIIITAFLTYYEVGDVMTVGTSKRQSQSIGGMTYKEYSIKPIPERVHFAQRAQTNQVEQMPVFIVGTIGCAVYVNGFVAAAMALLWSLIRIQYAIVYRSSVGLKYGDAMKGISKYTIPAYFIANSMLTATGIHALRCLLGI